MHHYEIDEYGRAVVDAQGLFELWFNGAATDDVTVLFDEEVNRFNAECIRHGKDEFVIKPPTAPTPHEERLAQWTIPEPYQQIDVREWCLSRCARDEEHARVEKEMKLYEERGMLPVLRVLIYIVDALRAREILWGVGRGSSVASYVLFLIGIHRIDSIRFGLEVEDFLR